MTARRGYLNLHLTTQPAETPISGRSVSPVRSTQITHSQIRLKQKDSRANTPVPINHTQKYRSKIDLLNQFIDELTKSGSVLSRDLSSMLDSLENELNYLRIDSGLFSDEVDRVHCEIEQLLTNAVMYKEDFGERLNLVTQYEDGMSNWQNWLETSLGNLERSTERVVCGVNPTVINHEPMDVTCSAYTLIQPYQVSE